MIQQFRANSFLLSEHTVYESLARELLNAFRNNAPQRWAIVCERKEDLLTIRTQLFSLLKKEFDAAQPEHELRAWAGVSLYTPDTLVRNFALTLSHNSPEQLGKDISRMLRNPFLDVVEQERLTRLLLLQLGYTGSDLAPLAKQILTLADTTLPPDESFLSVLLEVQQLGGSLKNISDVPDVSMRTICVAYQLLQKINASFCRLQSFVGQYWIPTFLSQLQATLEGDSTFKNFLLPQKFLSEPLLWVAAPEYARNEDAIKSNDTYRPGNFQAHWIDSLRTILFEARALWTKFTPESHKPSVHWWARTIIPTEQIVPEHPSAEIHILGTQSALEFHLESLQKSDSKETQFLLGDVNSEVWNIGRSDGSGVHALTPADFARYRSELNNSKESQHSEEQPITSTQWQNPAADRISTLHADFKKDWQRLDSFSGVIAEALNQYDLSPSLRKHGVSFDLLLHRFFDSESFTLGHLGVYATLPPALSFLPGLNNPGEFCVVGIPHSPTTPSFHLRILNAVFHYLRSKQIALDPIASEQAYRGYWQSFLTRSESTRFLLKGISQIKDIPEYAKLWCLPPVTWSIRSEEDKNETLFKKMLRGSRSIDDPEWRRLLPDHSDDRSTTLAVTSFEQYVDCPLKFYWLNLHNAEVQSQALLQPNRFELGQRAHAAAETFLRSLRHLLLLEERNSSPEQQWRDFMTTVDSEFVSQNEFISTNPQLWTQALLRVLSQLNLSEAQLNHASALTSDLRKAIFNDVEQQHSHAADSKQFAQLQQRLTREGVRRSFKKLIQSELLVLGEQPNAGFSLSQGPVYAAYLEQPVSFRINGSITLAGRIDRVDTHAQGDTIIDYKTSKVPKNERELVLLPSRVNTTNKLSVQGAIYSLAWAERQAKDDPDSPRGVRSFSLLRLKTLDLNRDPRLVYNFETPLKPTGELYEQIHSEYVRYADKLAAGHFPATPLLKDHCTTCALNTFCPTALGSEETTT